jgi:protein disulfide-isomerase
MLISKRIAPGLLALAVALLFIPIADAANNGQPVWESQFQRALAMSKKSGKPILANFTGSDWCPYCKKLDAEVFSTPEFKKWAAENVVLMEVDFPNSKQLPPATKKQNDELQAKYGVNGYPTVLFLDFNGNKLGGSGYFPGGPEKWISQASRYVAAAPKPEPLKIQTGFAQALAGARDSQKALLIVAYDEGSGVKPKIEAILTSDEMATLAPEKMGIVYVNTAATAAGEDSKALEEFRAAHKIKPTPVQFIAIDPRVDKPLAIIGGVPTAESVVSKIKAAMAASPARKPEKGEKASH